MPSPKWKPGQSGNPNGRPKRTVEEAALEKFRQRFNNGSFGDVLDALERQVIRGNIRAIELVFEYLLGKPTQRHEIDAIVALPDALAVLSMVYKDAGESVADKIARRNQADNDKRA